MVNELEISEAINELSGQDRTYAELIFKLFKDKYIEIYLGDSYEEISIEQISTSYPAVFCGKVIGAFKECLVIEAIHVSKDKKVERGGVIFINERGIRALTEIDDGHALQDMILRSSEAVAVYNAYINKSKVRIRK